MPSFKDKYEVEWNVELDLGTAYAIEDYDFKGHHPKIQLIPPQEDFFSSVITNPKAIFGIVWVILQEQINAYNEKWQSSDKQPRIGNELDFAKRLNGKNLQAMKVALWEECVNFFPEMGTTLKALIARFSRAMTIANERMPKEIDDQLSDEKINKIITDSLANAREQATIP